MKIKLLALLFTLLVFRLTSVYSSTGEGGGDFARMSFIRHGHLLLDEIKKSDYQKMLAGLEYQHFKSFLNTDKVIVGEEYKFDYVSQKLEIFYGMHDSPCWYDSKEDIIVLSKRSWNYILKNSWKANDEKLLKKIVFHCLSLTNQGLDPAQKADHFASRYLHNDDRTKIVILSLMNKIVDLVADTRNKHLFGNLDPIKMRSAINAKNLAVSNEILKESNGSLLDSQVLEGLLILREKSWLDFVPLKSSRWYSEGEENAVYVENILVMQKVFHELLRLTESLYGDKIYNDNNYIISNDIHQADYNVWK